ncbi:MAG: metal-dependent hydrolase [Deltaproteobacteria bacterium]|nr:metal-dependent hydrolase [Deltaproteobacteria bacterium]MBW2361110.1 metal-dependent hydrolase [Deltaproteobacteria bacterium]
MKARLPRIDFSRTDAHWIPTAPELAHQLNGASLVLPYLEPFLIKAMQAARPRVAEVAPEILRDLDVFNDQEANHTRLHAAYNRVLREQYPGLERFEAEIRADFQRFTAEMPLAWNLAYSEGFESTGVVLSEFFLQEIDDLFETADPAVTELWRWHLAEEFEHRNVAHDVLKALYPGWLQRLRGFRYSGRHLFGFTSRVRAHLLAIDRERGRVRDDAAQRRAARAFEWRQRRFQLPRVAKIFMPWYSPHPRRMQEPTRQVLASYDA